MLRRLRIENLVLIREAELDLAPGLNAITGETGAGKTILAQAVGLLLGARGDAALVGGEGADAYVEAELQAPAAALEEDDAQPLLELRPEDEEDVVVARRVFGDGRTRAYAWGRTAAREDVAAFTERLVAMSGQFEQRRLARPSYQLDVLDAFCGEAQLRRRAALREAWRGLQAARRTHEELVRGAESAAERLAELRALVEDAGEVSAEHEEELRSERERLRHVTELAEACAAAASALAPEDGAGAVDGAATAEAALAAVAGISTELDRATAELRDHSLRLREIASTVSSYLASLEADPSRLEQVEAELERLADVRRRHRAVSTAELVERAARARAELDAIAEGADPVAAAAEAVAVAQRRAEDLVEELRAERRRAAAPFSAAVTAELEGMGMGEGEFVAELAEREASASGGDDVTFLVRLNAGLPLSPVAQTASGGELSRVALAIAAVGGGETMVFDEIDAGIGGRTAHAVADTLVRLAERAQVVAITHLPQIASRAERHFSVEKVPGHPTHTRIRELTEDERREEIERMLGGREFLSTVADSANG
ncbi:MAG TPA: AAA family ATPase [Gaiellaceae bacterium]|nr:AAA family ATPase [Gaiellaceae bacterium]